VVIGVESLPADLRHAAGLMPAVDRLFSGAGWDADSLTDVYVSIGPGSFTGLRIAVSVARTLAWSVGARIVAVPTLEALARNGLGLDPIPANVLAVLDAQRGRIYAAGFTVEAGGLREILPARLTEPETIMVDAPWPVTVLGEGLIRHESTFREAGATVADREHWSGRAEAVLEVGSELARAGRFTEGGDLVPRYMRRPEAEEKWERLHGKDFHIAQRRRPPDETG
jgi:tRNA threonylcarbamoyladenosine biosynthesis protein TsaB